MSWFKSKSYPEFWTAYDTCFKAPQSKTIATTRFVVFDTETTGLNPSRDRILSIGCIAITKEKITVYDQLEIYISQEHFNPETVKIHGLLKEGTIEKLNEKEAIIQFLDYVKNAVLIAHHAAFDIAMINAVLKRMKLPKLKNKVIDTGHLFQKTRLNLDKTHFGLDELAKQFEIPLHDRHTASGDAYITALLFLKIISKLNPSSLKDLMNIRKQIGLL